MRSASNSGSRKLSADASPRVDSAKVNIAPPSIEARWFRIVGVPIGNGTDLYPDGDEVPDGRASCFPLSYGWKSITLLPTKFPIGSSAA